MDLHLLERKGGSFPSVHASWGNQHVHQASSNSSAANSTYWWYLRSWALGYNVLL